MDGYQNKVVSTAHGHASRKGIPLIVEALIRDSICSNACSSLLTHRDTFREEFEREIKHFVPATVNSNSRPQSIR